MSTIKTDGTATLAYNSSYLTPQSDARYLSSSAFTATYVSMPVTAPAANTSRTDRMRSPIPEAPRHKERNSKGPAGSSAPTKTKVGQAGLLPFQTPAMAVKKGSQNLMPIPRLLSDGSRLIPIQ